MYMLLYIFFFQAEDGIRDGHVTGVQTCALPISTAKLFGKELHKYTIDEAIKDKNVLGFHVDYINTGEFESYESLREQIVDEINEEKPHRTKRDIERDVYELYEYEVEMGSRDRQLLVV